MLAKQPGFTAAAALVLALGIGANTAMFSLVNAFLLKPLLIQNPSELVGAFSRDTKKADSYRAFSYPNYSDLREKNSTFASLMSHNLAMVGITEGEATRRTFADIVSSNYFTTFGVALFRGRTFTPEEERPGSGIPVAIISYSRWKKSGADPDVIGKTLHVNGRIFTIVGIAAEGFTGTTALISSELYLPLGMYESVINDFEGTPRPLAARDNRALMLVGRLRPGMTQQKADAELAVVAAQMEKAYPGENKDQTFVVRPLSRLSISTSPSSDAELVLPSMLLLSMAGIVLLIASLNLANMMLARGAARRKEIAIRLALGGGRGRIVRQLLTEGMLLAIIGGAASLVIASWSTRALVKSLSLLVPLDIVYSAGPDLRILAAVLGFCVLSTVVFGLAPAAKLSKPDLVSGLKETTGMGTAGGSRRLFAGRNILVMTQVALSLTLLTAAGLFLRSAQRAAQVSPGFRLENGVLIEVDASLAGYNEARGRSTYQRLLDRLRAVAGVESASLAATVPFGMISLGRGIQKAGETTEKPIHARLNIIGEDYFRTLGIPVLRGREFGPQEMQAGSAKQIAIIDQTAAQRLWPNQNPLGQRLHMSPEGTDPAREVEIVGVVGGIHENIVGQAVEPHLYLPFGQRYLSDLNFHLKIAAMGSDAEARLLDTVRREVRAEDNKLPVLNFKTMKQHMEASMDLWIVRTGATMFTIFGAVAMFLAVIGLYGLKAYTVSQRTREIGIRMALGAAAGENLRMILKEGLVLTLVGVAAGIALSLGLGKLLAGMLYEVSGADPVIFSVTPLLLIAVSMVACYLPARRAARVDPMVALRDE
jgi:predicted permease